jgi:hypothetical protein
MQDDEYERCEPEKKRGFCGGYLHLQRKYLTSATFQEVIYPISEHKKRGIGGGCLHFIANKNLSNHKQ